MYMYISPVACFCDNPCALWRMDSHANFYWLCSCCTGYKQMYFKAKPLRTLGGSVS